MKPVVARWLALAVLALPLGPRTELRSAETAPGGTIEGRIANPTNGEYLERARVTVDGTSLETFTDTAGFYRLTNVPAGPVQVRAFYTGLLPQIQPVTVTAGQIATLDFNLAAQPEGKPGEQVVQLSEFLVSTSREMDSAAIAINEQRFAPNIKGVVSTDEFGNVAEGSVGEFLKFLPGIAIEYEAGALARGISINGVPAENVPVTVNGFTLASAGGNNATSRTAQMDMTSITATSRIEVVYSPTPETPGSALAGAINMIPRSAFERSKPQLKLNTYVMMRDSARDIDRTPGPFQSYTRKIKPGFDFSYVRPVTKDFGFTLSGGHSENGTTEQYILNNWRGVQQATNGNAFPHTTPDRPYLTSTEVRDGTKNAARTSFGATIDWRFSPNDRLSFSYQHYYINFLVLNHTLGFTINRVNPGDFTPTMTRSASGQSELRIFNNYRDRRVRTMTPSLVWRHDGPEWKMEAGLGYSRAQNTFRAIDKGFFSGANARRTGVTVAFDDIFYLRPGRITVTDAAGAPVDPYNLDNYALTSVESNPVTSLVLQTGAQASAQREFRGRLPLTLKAGVDFRLDQRDQKQANVTDNFVGADNRASSTPVGSDDSAGRFLGEVYSERPGVFGFPRWGRIDNEELWDYYTANPDHFIVNPVVHHQAFVNGSKYAEELVSAAYLRGDLHFMDRRLRLVGGLRVEQTNIEAEGPLTDRTRNFRRDANGNVILVNGRPDPIVANTNSLEYAQLTVIDRGARADKEYLRWFPSLNASFNVRENLVARAAYYHSIGRPNFNQYAGGLTLPDETAPPSTSNRITVNNVGIKPWAARTVSTRLEYYFEGVGQISVGAFRREFENFFGSTTFVPTPDFLTLYGLNPDVYGAYDVATQHNLASTVRMTGADLSYKQALTFLPRWARGLHVFGNISIQRPVGDATAEFEGYIPRKASWGFSLVRERFNFRMNWSHQDRNRLGERTGNSIGPGTFTFQSSRVFLDILGEYHLTRRFGLYFTLRNVGDTPDQREVEGPQTPSHAQFRSREQAGSLWTFGVKGTF